MAVRKKSVTKKAKPRSGANSATSNVTDISIWQYRQPERIIGVSSIALIGLGFFSVLGSRFVDLQSQSPGAGNFDFNQGSIFMVWVISFALLHLLLCLSKSRVDPVMTGIGMCLIGFGILAQYRMRVFDGVFEDGRWKSLGAMAFPIGFIAMIITHQVFRANRYLWLSRAWILWFVISLAVVAYIVQFGERFRGALMASGNLTPTEILKVLIPLALAGFLTRATRESNTPAKKQAHSKKKSAGKRKADSSSSSQLGLAWWGGVGLSLLVIFAGLVIQRDLGMVLILAVSIGFQIFAGVGSWWILPIMGLGMFTGIGIVQNQFPHALARFDVWLNPFSDPTGAGWQILQSFSGMYSGGLWGEGWGLGDPERIPIAKSDFIYSVIGEEMGFLGCIILILLFLIFLNRAYRVTEGVSDRFGRLLGSGLVSILAVQVVVNIAGVVKVIPMTGVPLIFVSHGGTSLVTSLIILGFIMALNDSSHIHPVKTSTPRGKSPASARKNSKTRRNRSESE